jgi:hypothetical protein
MIRCRSDKEDANNDNVRETEKEEEEDKWEGGG